MRTISRIAAAAVVAAGGFAGSLAPASAQPIVTGGLVNVVIVDAVDVVLMDVNLAVGAALGLAANVCDVNVNVLAVQLRNGSATCTNTVTGQEVTIRQM
jgi:hypothetical protein